MSDRSELRKELRSMKRDLDRLSRRRLTERPTLGTQLQASLNIIDFATHGYYLNRTLYPRQATILKLSKGARPADLDKAADLKRMVRDASTIISFSAALAPGNALIAELKERSAQILILRYVHGYRVSDIAKLIGTTRSAIAVSLFRSRARLKKLIRASQEQSHEA